ncbi:MAG TPA: ATP-binding protein [Alphaproteobacteria bacterium]|nr:ATP-binding protein [Alphaproteobacteria bacterium]
MERVRSFSARLASSWLARVSAPAMVGVLVLAVCACLAGFVGWKVWQARQATLAEAVLDTGNLARTLAQHAAATFESVDLVLDGVVERVRHDGLGAHQAERLGRLLAIRARNTPAIREAGILDATGRWIVSSLPVLPAYSNADRDYFIYHRENDDPGMRINAPLRSRFNGRWTLVLTRRLERRDGSFAGVAFAAIDFDYFQRFYDSIDVGPQGVISLFRSDGITLVRHPFDDANIGRDLADSRLFHDELPKAPAGHYWTTSAFDGIRRLYAYERLPHYPIVVGVGKAEDDLLAPWRADARTDLAAGGLLCLLVVAMGTAIVVQLRRRTAAQQALSESERRYRLLADNVSDIISVIDARDVRTYVSPSCRQVLGYAPEELVGRNIFEIIHPQDAPGVEAALRSLQQDAPGCEYQSRMRRKDGGYIWVEIARRAIRDPESGALIETIGVLRDVSKRKDLEAALIEARTTAEHASEAKSAFLANMSHELRAPLNAVIGFADMIREQAIGPVGSQTYVEYAGLIRDSGEHLLDMINDILDFSKVAAGRLSLHEEEVDLGAVIDGCVRMLSLRADTAKVSLVFAPMAAPIELRCDHKRLKQIFLNLLTNALKYTPAGGRITVTAAVDGEGRPVISVADTGIGIAEEDLPKVLQAFAQVENESNRRSQGTGLGLPLTKRLVELHGGTLELTSRVGAGTTAIVRLPRERLVTPPGAGLRAVG